MVVLMWHFNPLLCWGTHCANIALVLQLEKESISKQDPLATNLWWEQEFE